MNLTTEFSERLVTLCDGRSGLRGGINVEIREPAAACSENHALPVLDFTASDETLDRYDEIISASGWQLANYRRNPVFQNAHQYGDVIFTLGKALVTEVREGRLFQRIEFATEVNPMSRIAYGLYRGKFLNAVSVGFIPVRWENGEGKAGEERRARGEERGGRREGFRRKYLEQELLEVSAVGIPANPNALALGLKSGAVEKADVRELSELLSQTLGSKSENVSTEQTRKVLSLARELRDLVKRL